MTNRVLEKKFRKCETREKLDKVYEKTYMSLYLMRLGERINKSEFNMLVQFADSMYAEMCKSYN